MMRIYVNTQLQCGQELILPSAIAHRILHVLRLKVGDQLILFNGAAGEFQATITAITKNTCRIAIEKFIKKNIESPLQIHLGQVIARGEKMDYTIQKATELGVSAITPLFSEHCNVKLDATRLAKRLEHWQATAIAASEQCGRCVIPQIFPTQNLEQWLQTVGTQNFMPANGAQFQENQQPKHEGYIPSSNDFSGFGTNRPKQFGNSARRQGASNRSLPTQVATMNLNIKMSVINPIVQLEWADDCCERRSQQSRKPKCEGYTRIILDHHSPNKIKSIPLTNEIVLLVGPEGGLSDDELSLAQQNNFIPVQLGPRILRTETAAIAVISALQVLQGDW